MPMTRSWQRDADQKDQRTQELERQLAEVRESLARIDRICQAAGVRTPNMSPLARVRMLASEHEARGAAVRVLDRMTRRTPAPTPAATIFTSEPLEGVRSPFCTTDGRYFASEEDARRAQLDIDERLRQNSPPSEPARADKTNADVIRHQAEMMDLAFDNARAFELHSAGAVARQTLTGAGR